MTLMGETPAATLAKACRDPQSLSDEELVVLEAYYASLITAVSRSRDLELRGGLRLSEGRWVEAAETNFFLMFRGVAGRTWWQKEGDYFGPEIGEVAESALREAPPDGECWISNWRVLIQEAVAR